MIFRFFLWIIIVQWIVGQITRPNWNPRFIGTTPLPFAAYLSFMRTENTSLEIEDQYTMYATSFDPNRKEDEVWNMKSPGRFLDDVSNWKDLKFKLVDDTSYWPNAIVYVPGGISGADSKEGIISTSGFIPPGKEIGKLLYFDTTQDPPGPPGGIDMALLDNGNYSYHTLIWKDMNNDGYLDAVTARFYLNSLGRAITQFLWLENEKVGITETWPEHIISQGGPGINIALANMTAGGRNYEIFVCAEFWNNRITIYWTENLDDDWTVSEDINSRIVAETGRTIDLLIDDFNKDGTVEFTVSEYIDDELGLLRMYFFPEDFRVDHFNSTIISEGFKAPPSGLFAEFMTPGSHKLFYPTLNDSLAINPADGLPLKPYIMLAGDDDGCYYIITPTNEDRYDFTYDTHILRNTTYTTVGTGDHADLDNDGYEEIIFAAYSEGIIYVYSYCESEVICGY